MIAEVRAGVRVLGHVGGGEGVGRGRGRGGRLGDAGWGREDGRLCGSVRHGAKIDETGVV